MKPLEHKTIVDKFLTQMLELIKSAKDFTLDQAPILAKEILNFNLVNTCMYALVFLIAVYASYRLSRWAYNRKEVDESKFFFLCIGVASFFIFACLFVSCVEQAAKIVVAPRLYIITYVSDLVKSHNSCGSK